MSEFLIEFILNKSAERASADFYGSVFITDRCSTSGKVS